MKKLIIYIEFDKSADEIAVKHSLDSYLMEVQEKNKGLNLSWLLFDSLEEATAWEEGQDKG